MLVHVFVLVCLLVAAGLPSAEADGVSIEVNLCPIPSCAPPCLQCPSGECTTKPGFFNVDGKKCPGCPVLDKCIDNKRPCPVVRCADPCSTCPSRKCTTKQGFLNREVNGEKCPGCCTLVKCLPKSGPRKCCAGPKPSAAQCGRSGCRCCSNGEWVKGNSGPTLSAKKVCGGLGLRPSKRCKKKCCQAKRPPRKECGRSGWRCCSNGEWVLGNSGPTLPAKTVCGRLDLRPSKRCSRIVPTTTPNPPKEEKCGNTICPEGLTCCNASCGMCTKPGGFCTQQACVDSEKDLSN